MSDVTTKVVWNGEMKFTGITANGIETRIDGERQSGASPVELLLEALGVCASIDVVVIMEKARTPLAKLEVVLDGGRYSPEPRYYESVRMRFDVWGDGIQANKLERAIHLSIGKYCSVYHSLRPDLKLQAEYRIHAPGTEAMGEYNLAEMSAPTSELQ